MARRTLSIPLVDLVAGDETTTSLSLELVDAQGNILNEFVCVNDEGDPEHGETVKNIQYSEVGITDSADVLIHPQVKLSDPTTRWSIVMFGVRKIFPMPDDDVDFCDIITENVPLVPVDPGTDYTSYAFGWEDVENLSFVPDATDFENPEEDFVEFITNTRRFEEDISFRVKNNNCAIILIDARTVPSAFYGRVRGINVINNYMEETKTLNGIPYLVYSRANMSGYDIDSWTLTVLKQ